MRVFILTLSIILLANVIIAEASNSAVVKTDGISTDVEQTPAVETKAKRWQLTASEYHRYLDLMNGPLGKMNPTIDPLLALGMFAETEQVERRYAELYAQQEYDLTERILRFQQAYHAAFNRLYPNANVVNQALLEPYFTHQNNKSLLKNEQPADRNQFQEGDRVLLFVSTVCHDCTKIIKRILQVLARTRNTGIDIYLREVTDDKAVRQWATTHGVSAALVENGTITLNQDQGLYQRLQNKTVDVVEIHMPMYLLRGERYFKIKLSEFGL